MLDYMQRCRASSAAVQQLPIDRLCGHCMFLTARPAGYPLLREKKRKQRPEPTDDGGSDAEGGVRLATPPPADDALMSADDAASPPDTDGDGDGRADSDSDEAGPSGLAPASSDESDGEQEPVR